MQIPWSVWWRICSMSSDQLRTLWEVTLQLDAITIFSGFPAEQPGVFTNYNIKNRQTEINMHNRNRHTALYKFAKDMRKWQITVTKGYAQLRNLHPHD